MKTWMIIVLVLLAVLSLLYIGYLFSPTIAATEETDKGIWNYKLLGGIGIILYLLISSFLFFKTRADEKRRQFWKIHDRFDLLIISEEMTSKELFKILCMSPAFDELKWVDETVKTQLHQLEESLKTDYSALFDNAPRFRKHINFARILTFAHLTNTSISSGTELQSISKRILEQVPELLRKMFSISEVNKFTKTSENISYLLEKWNSTYGVDSSELNEFFNF